MNGEDNLGETSQQPKKRLSNEPPQDDLLSTKRIKVEQGKKRSKT
jgi:hypothetical protein